ncbi:type II toxin-antitoxin system Phd/YefM family antitoxin [Levilactobacillus fujinensis]|uniref:Type II toxin-antitoxin system Phd/YefM family antitoxin n=1 Tax=Levilactobacillus fujinensis TaxID=2486024 RepID=A0ABW1TDU8_9LACO|nr:type II toxin-antitoxin system Phd/YefM family antitoxin [Levilactobacillus fujinensis]
MAVFTTDLNNAQKNLIALTDNIVAHDDHIIVRKPGNKNVVIMSEAEFNSWQERVRSLTTAVNREVLTPHFAQVSHHQTPLRPAERAHSQAKD